jgi:hypothetical protein
MNATQMRVALIGFLEAALKRAEDLEDSSTAYLIERALDEARSRQFSEIASAPLH